MSVFVLNSPDKSVVLHLFYTDSRVSWQIFKNGITVLDKSALGLVLEDTDLNYELILNNTAYNTIDESYSLPAFKKSLCVNKCNTIAMKLEKNGRILTVEGRAYNDGAAVRMTVEDVGDSVKTAVKISEVTSEATEFVLPEATIRVIGQKLIFTYEDQYNPIPLSDLYQNNLAFPVLAEITHALWAMYTEAGVFGSYGGGNLLSEKTSPLHLKVHRAVDQLTPIKGKNSTLSTPWRVVVCGGLNTIVETELLENLNPPSIVKDTSFIKAGVSAWSWMTENNSTRDINRIHTYVDYAAEMGFPYYLADGGWPGAIDIQELVKYCEERKVKLWIWEHCAAMHDYDTARAKMKLWKSWGVVGLKIDFFESEAQYRMTQYDMLAELGAEFELMLNFHGACKPAGEIRTWPHVMTREGVMGGEYLQNFSNFLPGGPDATHNCTLPFTRNAVGPMDYTPVVYRTYRTGTTDTHQTALLVIFTSYIQHIGESAEIVLANPCRPILSKIPAAWDETKLLEGDPGSFVTMARRKEDEWFMAAICALRPRNVDIQLDFLSEGVIYEAELYCDDISDMLPFDVATGALPPPDERMAELLKNQNYRPTLHSHDIHKVALKHFKVQKGDGLFVPLSVNGGFAMRIIPVKESASLK